MMDQTKLMQRNTSSRIAAADLVLIRGLPGSGKSTMASVLSMIGYMHLEADMFFEIDGTYWFDRNRLRQAHAWCQDKTKQALNSGNRVVVSNTFTQVWEIEPYLRMTRHVQVIEARGEWENCHEVPHATIAEMAKRWEQFPRPQNPEYQKQSVTMTTG